MGGQCIVGRETPSSYPGGNHHFFTLPFSGDSLEMKKDVGELGLIAICLSLDTDTVIRIAEFNKDMQQ